MTQLSEEERQSRNARVRRWRERHLQYAREHTKAWRARTIARIGIEAFRSNMRASKNAWMSIPENRIRHCLGQAKRRALQNSIPFSIIVEDLFPLPSICPVLGIKLNYGGTKKRGFVNDSPSIDRIDSSKGYIKGNVRIISWRANRLKSDATIAELKSILKYMEGA